MISSQKAATMYDMFAAFLEGLPIMHCTIATATAKA
jgi:hypothetical protein